MEGGTRHTAHGTRHTILLQSVQKEGMGGERLLREFTRPTPATWLQL